MLPEEMMKDFIGKEVTVSYYARLKVKGVIIKTEANWIEIKTKDSLVMLNGALVRDIKLSNK